MYYIGGETMKKARAGADVGLLIKFLNNSITNEINRNLLKFNLTATQHEVLVYILKNENKRDVFQKDVEKHLKLTNPTITGIIKRLEEKGMIVRCASTGDARCKCLHVTEEGHNILHKCFHQGILSVEAKLVKNISEKDQVLLKELLYKALKNLEE